MFFSAGTSVKRVRVIVRHHSTTPPLHHSTTRLKWWSDGVMEWVPEGQHDRSLARSAWDSATLKEPSRRVRYDSSRCAQRFEDWREEISNAVSLSGIEMI